MGYGIAYFIGNLHNDIVGSVAIGIVKVGQTWRTVEINLSGIGIDRYFRLIIASYDGELYGFISGDHWPLNLTFYDGHGGGSYDTGLGVVQREVGGQYRLVGGGLVGVGHFGGNHGI